MKQFLPLAALLVGCRTLPHSDPPEPRVEVLAEWSAESATGEVESEPWWQSFESESLTQVVTEALRSNPSLKESAARIGAAAAEARIAGADRLPTLGASGSAARSKNIFVGLPVPGGSNVLQSQATSYGVSLDVSWEADLWGRIAAQSSAAEHQFLATEAEYIAALQSIAAQTSKAWFSWQAASMRVATAERSAKSFADARDMIRRRLDTGRATAFDLKLAETSVATANSGLASRREIEARALRQVELLLGRHPTGELEGTPALPKNPPAPPTGVPGQLISRRPDLVAAEARLLAADDNLYAARANLYPRLTLSGSVGRTSDNTGDLVDPDFSVWSLAAGLAQPIFQGGRLRAAVDLADANVESALAGFESALLRAVGEVEIALTSEHHLALLQAAQDHARDLALEASTLAEERYAAGRLDVLEFLEAERRAIENENASIDVRLLRLQTRVDLHLALGGGFDWEETAQ